MPNTFDIAMREFNNLSGEFHKELSNFKDKLSKFKKDNEFYSQQLDIARKESSQVIKNAGSPVSQNDAV